MIEWRVQYDEEADQRVRLATRTHNVHPSLTQQHHAESADLNIIVARFGLKDVAVPPAAMDPSYFGDFASVPDFREALDTTREAAERFNALPASIRSRFNNDPVELFAFVTDQANAEESVRLGLLTKANLPPIVADPVPVTP